MRPRALLSPADEVPRARTESGAAVDGRLHLDARSRPGRNGRRDVEPVLPDGCPELVLQFGDRFERVYEDGSAERQSDMVFAGQLTSQVSLRPTGAVATLGVRFRPGSAAAHPPHAAAAAPRNDARRRRARRPPGARPGGNQRPRAFHGRRGRSGPGGICARGSIRGGQTRGCSRRSKRSGGTAGRWRSTTSPRGSG